MEARLATETDLAGFREEARVLLAQQVPPEDVHWLTASANDADPFADPASPADSRPHSVPRAASAIVPASFLRLCEIVVLHHDPDRFALLYRLLWRLVHEPGLRNNPIDADMLHAHQMGQSVRRDMHKMKAFLRFRTLNTGTAESLQLAWFEPVHHIVETVAPWFAKRSPQSVWVILTPERSVQWDTRQLHFGPGLRRDAAPAPDAPDAAWLTAYESVFGARPFTPPHEEEGAAT
jgi:uracil-DNA glycosylase